MLLAHSEIKEAATIHICILKAVDVAAEQAIQTINGWVAGADISIGLRQILLKPRGGDAGCGEFHPGHGASRLLAGSHRVQQAGPSIMGVASKADQPLARDQSALQDRLPLYPVAIPSVEVVGDLAGFGEESLLFGGEVGEGGTGGELLQRRGVFIKQGGIARI